MESLNADAVIACADLAERTGAKDFMIGYLHDDVPVEEAAWYAQATYNGVKIIVENHVSPSTAALAMAERLLDGGTCKCRQLVTLNDDAPGCRWRLMGQRWESGCKAKPLTLPAEARGNLAAMNRALQAPTSRRERRAAQRKKR